MTVKIKTTRTLATSALALTLATGSALAEVSRAEVLDNYADIAEAIYDDSLIAAQRLQSAVDTLIAKPSADTLQAAKSAWLAARVPYQQSEVYRFGNAIVDDWEGKVNAWPLDEGLIDYVDMTYGGPTDENALAALNVVASPSISISGCTRFDASSALTSEAKKMVSGPVVKNNGFWPIWSRASSSLCRIRSHSAKANIPCRCLTQSSPCSS